MSATTEREVLELAGERTPVGTLLRDLVRHRALLPLMARQDYSARYRSASLGLLWSVALPLLQGLVIAAVFSHLVGGGRAKAYVPYVIIGISCWSYVSQSVSAAATSIVDSGAIAGRIYFPRLLLPAIPPTANLPAIGISLTFAEVIALATGHGLHWTLLLAPVVVLASWALAVTGGAVLTMAHVYSRDVRYLVQAGIMVLFYAAPIIYSLSSAGGSRALPDSLRPYVLANPGTGIVQLGRYALVGDADYIGTATAWLGGWIAFFTIVAVFVYARFERVSVDRL
jgi:ABC-type polysaccharide/polyol phosphate export permease